MTRVYDIGDADGQGRLLMFSVMPLPSLSMAEPPAMLGLRYKVGIVVSVLLSVISLGLVMLLVMLLLRMLTRGTAIASASFAGLLAVIFVTISSTDAALPWATGTLIAVLLTVLLTRVGLVAVVTALAVNSLMMTSPITSDIHAWYAPAGMFSLITVAALLGFARHSIRPPSIH